MSKAEARFVLIFVAGFSLALALVTMLACSQAEPEQKSPSAPAAQPAPTPVVDPAMARAEADKIFAERCTTCHGATGAGDGPVSAGLVPRPRNLMDPAWQQSVTDEHIEKIVMYGGAAVGKSPAMPPNPDLMSKPEIVAAVREHVRALAK